MRTIDNTNDLRMHETAGDFVRTVRIPQEAALKVQVEPDLILQDISEEDFKKAVRDTVIVKQVSYDDVPSVVEECEDMFYNMHHRECPLTVPRHMDGLVDIRTFWHDSQSSRNGLYDFCRPETKEKTLVSVAFPAKQLNVNRVTRIPSNDPAPLSIMAQYLYHQMEELAQLKTEVACSGTDNDNRKNVHKGMATAWGEPEEEPIEKKRTGSRVMRCLRKLFGCIRKNDDE